MKNKHVRFAAGKKASQNHDMQLLQLLITYRGALHITSSFNTSVSRELSTKEFTWVQQEFTVFGCDSKIMKQIKCETGYKIKPFKCDKRVALKTNHAADVDSYDTHPCFWPSNQNWNIPRNDMRCSVVGSRQHAKTSNHVASKTVHGAIYRSEEGSESSTAPEFESQYSLPPSHRSYPITTVLASILLSSRRVECSSSLIPHRRDRAKWRGSSHRNNNWAWLCSPLCPKFKLSFESTKVIWRWLAMKKSEAVFVPSSSEISEGTSLPVFSIQLKSVAKKHTKYCASVKIGTREFSWSASQKSAKLT